MVTYPLPMPEQGVASVEFKPLYVQAVNRLNGGVHSTQLAPTGWDVRVATTNLARRSERKSLWQRFVMAARGSLKTILLYDPDQPFPAAYKNLNGLTKAGGGTFDGTGNVDTVTDIRTYVISGLPANFVLTAGDYISFMKSNRYSLHMIMDDVVANGSGVATVVVEPEVPAMFDAAATFNLARPKGEFIMDYDSLNMSKDVESGTISFTAKSVIL